MPRPTKYKEDFPEIAKALCRKGATDKDLARAFGVSESTLNEWKKRFPEFSESIKQNKPIADAKVENSAFKLCEGYEYEEVEEIVSKSPQGTTVRRKKTTRQIAPNMNAIRLWLFNRCPADWRDVKHQQISGEDGKPIEVQANSIDLSKLSKQQLEQLVEWLGEEED